VKFVNDDGRENNFMPPGNGGIALLAVHSIDSLFAYTEHEVDPQIYIMKYPSFMKFAVLSGLFLMVF